MGGQLHDISEELIINSSNGDYRIISNSNILEFDFPVNAIVIADSKFEELLQQISNNKIFLDAIEEKKSLETCVEILSQLHDFGANKSTIIVCIGGGILQDVSTLVASLFMRGIDWIFFPTTKMSQFDSCIGGKSSINLNGKKNLVGNIFPPVEIHIDFSFGATLSQEAVAAGYLEAIKISFAHGKDGFQKHLALANGYKNIENISEFELNRLVLGQKKYFVEKDEFDKGIRQLLNFGHTFGHAIESASGYSIQHGLAIGLGMLMALNHPLSENSKESNELRSAIWNILKFAGFENLLSINNIEEDNFISAFMADKKHSKGSYSIIIPGKNGLEKSSNTWDAYASSLIVGLLNQLRMDISNEVQ